MEAEQPSPGKPPAPASHERPPATDSASDSPLTRAQRAQEAYLRRTQPQPPEEPLLATHIKPTGTNDLAEPTWAQAPTEDHHEAEPITPEQLYNVINTGSRMQALGSTFLGSGRATRKFFDKQELAIAEPRAKALDTLNLDDLYHRYAHAPPGPDQHAAAQLFFEKLAYEVYRASRNIEQVRNHVVGETLAHLTHLLHAIPVIGSICGSSGFALLDSAINLRADFQLNRDVPKWLKLVTTGLNLGGVIPGTAIPGAGIDLGFQLVGGPNLGGRDAHLLKAGRLLKEAMVDEATDFASHPEIQAAMSIFQPETAEKAVQRAAWQRGDVFTRVRATLGALGSFGKDMVTLIDTANQEMLYGVTPGQDLTPTLQFQEDGSIVERNEPAQAQNRSREPKYRREGEKAVARTLINPVLTAASLGTPALGIATELVPFIVDGVAVVKRVLGKGPDTAPALSLKSRLFTDVITNGRVVNLLGGLLPVLHRLPPALVMTSLRQFWGEDLRLIHDAAVQIRQNRKAELTSLQQQLEENRPIRAQLQEAASMYGVRLPARPVPAQSTRDNLDK